MDHQPRRGTDRPHQDAEADDVRPSRLRTPSCSCPPCRLNSSNSTHAREPSFLPSVAAMAHHRAMPTSVMAHHPIAAALRRDLAGNADPSGTAGTLPCPARLCERRTEQTQSRQDKQHLLHVSLLAYTG